MTPAFLGIDMGGTATRWVLVDEDGALLERGQAPGATGHLFNPAERERFTATMANIGEALRSQSSAVFMGVTGLGPRATAEAIAIVGSQLRVPQDAIAATDDMELAFRAAFDPGEGHLVAAGTGSIGLHITATGEVIRVGGRGILIDDAGSGAWIALTALDRLYRLIDEHGRPGGAERLADALAAPIGGASWDDARAFVYAADRGRIAELAKAVAAAGGSGDPIALQVLADAAGELARLGRALIARAGALPVGFVGGVLELHPLIKERLTEELAGIEVRFPRLDAALKAAEIARRGLTPG